MIAIVPRPAHLTTGEGEYVLTADTRLAAAPGTEDVADLLREQLAPATGLPLAPGTGAGIELALDAGLGPEAYRLDVTPDGGVRIVGGDVAGTFHGTQTLRQLLPPKAFASAPVTGVRWAVPAVSVEDRPRYAWRGAMLDVARHFFDAATIRRWIDLLALHKLNVAHLHLTDDQGWRLEIARYPRLTEVGAHRRETLVGRPDRKQPERDRYDGVPHGGFLTQDDVREIVAYAARRHVTVVPEIDLPGHSVAAIAAYPELGDGPQYEVSGRWGIEERVLNVEDGTVAFFTGVLDEVLELFPSAYVHVGGDEVPLTQWERSERARELMRERGLREPGELHGWFIRQLGAHLRERGRKLVGWDEILEGGPDPDATVMSWRGEDGGVRAARAGLDVVMASNHHTYFDYYESEDREAEGLAIGGLITLAKAYEFEAVPAAIAGEPDAAAHVLGGQCQLWTEYVPTRERLDHMAYPRVCAFAETVWTPERDSYSGFVERLRPHLARLDALGVAYRPLG